MSTFICFLRVLCVSVVSLECSGLAPAAEPPVTAPSASIVADWKFDGDAQDSGPSGWNGKPMGRVAFFDSPVGGQGQLLSLNGVDAFVQVENPAAGNFGERDFSVSLWVLPLDLQWVGLVQKTDPKQAWSLFLSPDGVVHFGAATSKSPRVFVQTAPNAVAIGQWCHIAFTVKRSGPAAGARIYIDGVAAASGAVPPGSIDSPLPLLIGKGDGERTYFNGLMDEVQLFDGALGPAQIARITDAGLLWLRPKPWAREPFGGHFELRDGDSVVFAGAENMLAAQQSAYLETLLTAQSTPKRVFFRDMAWEGDTALEQFRILNFGPWPYQLRRVGATVMIAQFGQIEAMRGKAGLPEFVAAYDKLLDELTTTTRRIVLLSPVPFEKPAPPLPDLSSRNDDVRLYADAVREIAEKRGALFVDLFSALEKRPDKTRPLTRDGIHLLPYGQWLVAQTAARQLGFDAPDDFVSANEELNFARPQLQALREAIHDKNKLWRSYWRPTNWAFLNGDRVTQPSSHDDRDPRLRWFPAEVQESSALIQRQEARIAELAAQAGHAEEKK